MKKENIGMIEMLLCAALWSIAGIFMKLIPWNGFAVAGFYQIYYIRLFAVLILFWVLC